MDASSFAVQLLNGLAQASTLFLVAAGLSLIFGVTKIVNFAHGSFYMLGVYTEVLLLAVLVIYKIVKRLLGIVPVPPFALDVVRIAYLPVGHTRQRDPLH